MSYIYHLSHICTWFVNFVNFGWVSKLEKEGTNERTSERTNERTNNPKNERWHRILLLNTNSYRSRVIHCKRGVHIRATFTLEEFPLSERGYCFSEKSTEVIVVVHVRGAWQYRGVPLGGSFFGGESWPVKLQKEGREKWMIIIDDRLGLLSQQLLYLCALYLFF